LLEVNRQFAETGRGIASGELTPQAQAALDNRGEFGVYVISNNTNKPSLIVVK